MNVLALDLGTNTGWAISVQGHVSSGCKTFNNDRFEGGGMRYLKFKMWLSSVLEQSSKIDMVVFEEVRRHAGTGAAHVYGGFLACLTSWCEQEKIPYQGVPVATIKKHATGKGNAGKEAVIKAMKAKCHNTTNDNECDALAIMYYARDVMRAQATGTIWDGPQAPNMSKPMGRVRIQKS